MADLNASEGDGGPKMRRYGEFYLQHEGPRFPPGYKKLDLPLIYDKGFSKKIIRLSVLTQEVAVCYVRMKWNNKGIKQSEDNFFNDNFFESWRKIMTNEEKKIITEFSKCRFEIMYSWLKMNNRLKVRKVLDKKPYYCIRGRKIYIDNYKLQPPSLIMEGPDKGRLRKRVKSEDITINCSKNTDAPKPLIGQWKALEHDDSVDYIAFWTTMVTGDDTDYIRIPPKEEYSISSLECQEDEKTVWKWFDEQTFYNKTEWLLENKGPKFPQPYIPLPKEVKIYYDGRELKLSPDAEEVAGLYAKLYDKEVTRNATFNDNFLHDWRKVMQTHENRLVTDLKLCDFTQIRQYYLVSKYSITGNDDDVRNNGGWCIIGQKEIIPNPIVEPPGLLRSKSNPNRGKWKERVEDKDITINCSDNSPIVAAAIDRGWKVKNLETVKWLIHWKGKVQGDNKYIYSNSIKDAKRDFRKFIIARKFHEYIDDFREQYEKDWESDDVKVRQMGVALFLIDRLALRAGYSKKENRADTVGCLSLRVEHVQLSTEKDYEVAFDFIGKSSVPYEKLLTVPQKVYDNLSQFIKDKDKKDVIFNHIKIGNLTKKLKQVAQECKITCKVIRTYRASYSLYENLEELTRNPNGKTKNEVFAEAHEIVARLLNHKKSDETPLLQTSLKYYIDPRIIVAWCKKQNVLVANIIRSKQLRDQFHWAIETTQADFCWCTIKPSE